jgi:hypothetical protein
MDPEDSTKKRATIPCPETNASSLYPHNLSILKLPKF